MIVGACWPLIEKKWHLGASDVALNQAASLWLAWEGRKTEKYHTKAILISRIRGCNVRGEEDGRGQPGPRLWSVAGLDNGCALNSHVCSDGSDRTDWSSFNVQERLQHHYRRDMNITARDMIYLWIVVLESIFMMCINIRHV